MKKYIEFITENKYINYLTEDEFFKLYKNEYDVEPKEYIFRKVNIYYSDLFSDYNKLKTYKKIKNEYSDINIVNPKTINRISPNSDYNYVNLLVSNLESWSQYPARNKSLICGNYERANSHYITYDTSKNNLFVVLPKKNSKIGLCNSSDFWTSFSLLHNIDNLNDFLNKTFKDLNLEFDERDWISLKNAIEKINPIFIFNYLSKDYDIEKLKVKYNISSNETSSLNLLNKYLNPKNNNFTTKKFNKNFEFTLTRQECWTDSTSILIRYETAKNLNII